MISTIDRYQSALREIEQGEGQVCSDYENCNHIACESSYRAWSIAHKVLESVDVIQPVIWQFAEDEKEIHMMGDFVGVVWALRERSYLVNPNDPQNKSMYTKVERVGKPYISFPVIRDDYDPPFLDEDKSIAGGLSKEQSAQVARELLMAVEYLEQIGE